jgi:UDP-N-acetylglucosamine:LPS N-acetylglucosamine transferase
MKICIPCSAGGHFAEMKKLEHITTHHQTFYITFSLEGFEHDEGDKVYFVTNPDIRNPQLGIRAFIKNIFQTIDILRKEKPDVIITSCKGNSCSTRYYNIWFFFS